ncbi:MAG: hypothetical protein U9O66_02245 [Patescibacteria group bacterium]|nr:hypothetical protein [Patescibacteria group bacterium]
MTPKKEKAIIKKYKDENRYWFKFNGFRGKPIKFYSERHNCTICFIPFSFVRKEAPRSTRSTANMFAVFFQKRDGSWKLLSLQLKKQILDRFAKDKFGNESPFVKSDLEDLLNKSAGY